MAENTGCAGPGRDTKKVLKQQIGNKKNKIENTFLYKCSTNNLEKFYTNQYFIYRLQETKKEWDSLIIFPEYSAVINIEGKLGLEKGDKLALLKDASDQTKQHFFFMQKLFGGMLPKDWVFVRAACVPYIDIVANQTMPCSNCQQFILLEKDVNDVTLWLKQLIEHNLVPSHNCDQAVYENLVAELIYQIIIKDSSKFDKHISDPLTISKETEKALTGKSDGITGESDVPVYMLNNEQLQAVDPTARFLIIDGEYGTSNTYVLKERAKRCAIDNTKDHLFYIDLTALTHNVGKYLTRTKSSFMNNIYFESYPNIRVITIKDLGISEDSKQTDIINNLNSFLRDNHCDHLFIDEMIIGEIVFPDSIQTICVKLKELDGLSLNTRANLKNKKAKWLETMKVNHDAVHVNLTKNMRNSQKIINLAKFFLQDSTQQMFFSPDTNVTGPDNVYYRNIYDINPSLLAVAAVEKFFIQPKESVVVLSNGDNITQLFKLFNERFSCIRRVVSDFKAHIKKPEGILVANTEEFQGAQARNIIICDTSIPSDQIGNLILRAMSFAIIISDKDNYKLKNSGAIEDKNLHEFIYTYKCHHYHNKDKHDMSALTMAILDKYKLLDKDESITIITYSRISKDIIREANTKDFLSLSPKEKENQIEKKIKSENKELYEDVVRNISRNYADVTCSYFKYIGEDLDLINKPRHINYIKMDYAPDFDALSAFENIILFSDENIDQKHEFAAWGDDWSLNYSDNKTSIDVKRIQMKRNKYNAFCKDIMFLSEPKFVIVVHDDNFETFSLKESHSLNLIEDDNLHEYISVENLNPLTLDNNLDNQKTVKSKRKHKKV